MLPTKGKVRNRALARIPIGGRRRVVWGTQVFCDFSGTVTLELRPVMAWEWERDREESRLF